MKHEGRVTLRLRSPIRARLRSGQAKDEGRILITAGPTREYIDPVRYLSNDSSGRMGFALAAAAARRGFKVTLIAGPVALLTPKGVRRIDVVSARDMRRGVKKYAPHSDIIIMAAAVSDWRPARFSRSKIKRRFSRTENREQRTENREPRSEIIRLKENPDILKEIGEKKKKGQLIVGFALETGSLEKNALAKLARKNCDWIVANLADTIGSASSRALLLGQNGKRISLPRLPKEELAAAILSHLLY